MKSAGRYIDDHIFTSVNLAWPGAFDLKHPDTRTDVFLQLPGDLLIGLVFRPWAKPDGLMLLARNQTTDGGFAPNLTALACLLL